MNTEGPHGPIIDFQVFAGEVHPKERANITDGRTWRYSLVPSRAWGDNGALVHTHGEDGPWLHSKNRYKSQNMALYAGERRRAKLVREMEARRTVQP